MVAVRMMLLAVVVMSVVMMGIAKNHGTDNIHQQADDRHDDSFLIMNRLRREDSLHRPKHQHGSDPKQEDGAGEPAKNFNLPGTEGESRVRRIASCCCIGECA
jgi:hypothetical protein